MADVAFKEAWLSTEQRLLKTERNGGFWHDSGVAIWRRRDCSNSLSRRSAMDASRLDRTPERLAFYEIGCTFADHHGRRVEVAGDDRRHDRGVHDPQACQPTHPCFRIDYGREIAFASHLASAAEVKAASTEVAAQGIDFFDSLRHD